MSIRADAVFDGLRQIVPRHRARVYAPGLAEAARDANIAFVADQFYAGIFCDAVQTAFLPRPTLDVVQFYRVGCRARCDLRIAKDVDRVLCGLCPGQGGEEEE